MRSDRYGSVLTIRYDLSSTEQVERTDDLMGRLDRRLPIGFDHGGSGPVLTVWLGWEDPMADVVRTIEARTFPGFESFVTRDVEACSRFLLVVDRTERREPIGFVARVTSLEYGPRAVVTQAVGLPMFDEVLAANPELSLKEATGYYAERGVNLSSCVAVETQVRLSDDVTAPGGGLRWSDYAYIEMFRALMAGPPGERVVFAHVNRATRRSLGAIGADIWDFAGRSGLRSPAAVVGEHDADYSPACVPGSVENIAMFRELETLAAPTVTFG